MTMNFFGLSEDLEKLLNTGGRLTNEDINPSHLNGLDFGKAWKLPKNFLAFDEQSAANEIDRIAGLREQLAHGSKVADACIELAKDEVEYQKRMAKLRRAVAKLQITREDAFAEWKTLQNEVQVAGRRATTGHGAAVERQNVAYAKFTKGLQERLHKDTTVANGGTGRGSVRLGRQRQLENLLQR